MTEKRSVFIDKEHPDAYKAMVAVSKEVTSAATSAGLAKGLVELLNIRISQINGCAYCLDLHVRLALKAGESTQRVATLSAWRDTRLFTDKERAALAAVEAFTTLPGHGLQESYEDEAREHLSEEEYSAVAWVAVAMNAFNRISIISHHPVKERGVDKEVPRGL